MVSCGESEWCPGVPLFTSAHLPSVTSWPTCCEHLDLGSACSRPHQGHPPSMVRPTAFWWPVEPTQDAWRPTSKGKFPLSFSSHNHSQSLINLLTSFPATFELFISKEAGRNRGELLLCPLTQLQVKNNPKFLKAGIWVIILIILVNKHDHFLSLKPFAYTISLNCCSWPLVLDNAAERK